MSEWIKLHAAVFSHPKTLRMAKRLQIAPAAVAGHLSALWCWALEYAPDGDLARFDAEELEIAAGWQGEDGAFLAAAVAAGYLDDAAGYAIHDWESWGGRLAERRQHERERQATRRAQAGVAASSSAPPDAPSSAPRRAPSSAPRAPARALADDGFEAFWTAYPRRVHKTEARAAWRRLSADDRAVAPAAAANITAYVMATNKELEYIPHPATFLGRERKFEDWVKGLPAGYKSERGAGARLPQCICGGDFCYDERGLHCPICGHRPATESKGTVKS